MKQDLKGKRLMILGGVRPVCEIINEAHRLGLEVYETDYLIDSPAKKVADKSFMTSCIDIDAVVELCKQQNVDGVFTGYTDSLLPYTEQVCRKLGKPFWGNAENIDMSINKLKFKEACEKSGVSVVPWKKVTDTNYREELANIQLPVLFKPADNSGSRGVFKCYKEEDLIPLCEKSLEFSKTKEVLVERLMNSHNEFSVYYMMNHGEILLTGMGDRYIYEISQDIAPVGQGMLFPSTRLQQWKKKMDPSMRKFFKDNNMNEGFCFVQGFYEGGNFFIHEIGYRLNGGFSFKLVEYFCGYNQVHQLLRYSLTGNMDNEELKKNDPTFGGGIGMILTISLKKGKISVVEGIQEIEKLPNVVKFYQLNEIGAEISSQGTTAEAFAYIMLAAPSQVELKETIKKIEETIKVFDENGDSMIHPMLNPNKLNFEML